MYRTPYWIMTAQVLIFEVALREETFSVTRLYSIDDRMEGE
jgi:hypothetical protein